MKLVEDDYFWPKVKVALLFLKDQLFERDHFPIFCPKYLHFMIKLKKL